LVLFGLVVWTDSMWILKPLLSAKILLQSKHVFLDFGSCTLKIKLSSVFGAKLCFISLEFLWGIHYFREVSTTKMTWSDVIWTVF
jgi:hypothetical protein